MSDRLSRKRNVDPSHSGHGSRDSSTSSQVRCGCQYFQTDSLLPEKQSLIGLKPNITTIMNTLSKTNDMVAPVPADETGPSQTNSPRAARDTRAAASSGSQGASPGSPRQRTASASAQIGDHDYEPITPMSTNRPTTPPPILKVPDANSNSDKPNDASASGEKEKQFLKLPAEEDIVAAGDEDYDEEEEYEEEEVEEEEEMSDDQGEFEDEEDEGMTAEELQAHMEERFFNQAAQKVGMQTSRKPEPESPGAKILLKRASVPPQSFQQKLKTKADKVKASFQTMTKRKEASSGGNDGDEGEPPAKSKFQFPKRPKFDRSKFKLPDRPKLKMPERGKFKMPKRPEIKMPNMPKFNLPSRSNLPNFQLPKRSNSFKEGDATAGTSTMGSKKNLFDFKTMTYPRIFNKRKREENGQSETPEHKTQSIPRTSSAPSTPLWTRANLTHKWGQMITELKSKEFHKKMKPNDDTSASQASKPRSSFPGSESLDDSERQKTRSASSGLDTDKEQHSSGASSLRDRKGVLEEINSDEFFLREKGLSRDNVDVSQFLTREIRDAFKADADKEESDFEDEEEIVPDPPQKQATPPQRSKSFNRFVSTTLGRFKKDKKEVEEKKEQYKTYPPRKAERKRRESELFLIIPLKDENDPEYAPSIPINDHTDEDYEVQRQVFKAVVKPQQDNLQVPEQEKRNRTVEDTKESTPVTAAREENKENVAPVQKVVQAQIEEIPSAPRRKRSLTQSLRSEGILKDVDNNRDNKSLRSVHSGIEPEPGLHQYPTPVAPRRRSRSFGTSLTSEDRTSRGADSMPSEEQDETVGYAIVEKSTPAIPATPPRSKPPRPPPPCRRRRTFNMIRDQGLSNFFTFPRRKSYVEDIPVIEKSYSTVGPTRPPRRSSKSRSLKEPLYADGSVHSDIGYIDNGSDTKSIDQRIQDFVDDFKQEYGGSIEDKDLQSDDVIEKMKGRPLPAPPRPPRKSRQDGEDSDIEDIEQDAKMSGTTPPIDNIAVNLHTEDLSIAIQTDPLSDEYVVTNNEEIEGTNTLEKAKRVVPLKGERKSLNQEKKSDEELKPNEQLNNLEYPTLPLRRDRKSQSKENIKKDIKILNTSPTENKTSFSAVVNPQQSFMPIDEFCRQQTAARLASAVHPLPRSHAQPEPHQSPRPPPRRDSPPKPPSRQKDNDSTHGDFRPEVRVLAGPENEYALLKAQKLQIQELDVNRIHVNELQASRITVHDLDSDTINVSRINSTSGNLVIDNIELPSDILQSISGAISGAISFTSATAPVSRSQVPPSDSESPKHDQSSQVSPSQQSAQSQTQSTPSSHESTQTKPASSDSTEPERPKRRPSSPSPDYSVPVPKYYRTRKYSYDSEDVMIVPIPVPRVRRRHHHPETSSSARDDSEQDSALDLGRRFVNVVTSDIMSLIHTFIQQLPRGEKQQQRDVVQMFICIFITIFALFFLVGFGNGNKTIHTHHWDYQFPPPPP